MWEVVTESCDTYAQDASQYVMCLVSIYVEAYNRALYRPHLQKSPIRLCKWLYGVATVSRID